MSNDNAELPQQLQQQHHVLRELFDVSGKKVVVTGGASGIGRMLVEGLVKQGAQVLTCSRKIGSTFATELNACGYAGMCYSLQVDVTVDDDLDRLHEYASAVFDGRLDVLINNSGTNFAKPIEEYTREAFMKVLQVNLASVFATTRALLELLKAAGSPSSPARIINIGSVDGIRVSPIEHYAYGASKAGVHQLTRVLAAFLGKHSITVNAIAAGAFRSKMMAATLERMGETVRKSSVLNRIGNEKDIVGTVVWLCSPAGAFVTGAIVVLDGGALCRSRM